MRRPFINTFLLAVALLAACDSGPTDSPGEGDARLSATIGGQPWAADDATIVALSTSPNVPGSLSFSGGNLSGAVRNLTFHLGRIPGPGTYPLGVNQLSNGGGLATWMNAPAAWTTPLSGKAGSITIESLGEGWASGTFTFTGGSSAAGTADSIAVTNGRFRVPVSPSWTPVSADQRGSEVTATLDGERWNGATIVSGSADANIAGFSATSTDYTVILSVAPVSGPGSGPISTVNPTRRVQVVRVSDGAGWGGTAADQGTVTIESIDDARVVGSFSGTLAPVGAPTRPPLAVADGRFDVRRSP